MTIFNSYLRNIIFNQPIRIKKPAADAEKFEDSHLMDAKKHPKKQKAT